MSLAAPAFEAFDFCIASWLRRRFEAWRLAKAFSGPVGSSGVSGLYYESRAREDLPHIFNRVPPDDLR